MDIFHRPGTLYGSGIEWTSLTHVWTLHVPEIYGNYDARFSRCCAFERGRLSDSLRSLKHQEHHQNEATVARRGLFYIENCHHITIANFGAMVVCRHRCLNRCCAKWQIKCPQDRAGLEPRPSVWQESILPQSRADFETPSQKFFFLEHSHGHCIAAAGHMCLTLVTTAHNCF